MIRPLDRNELKQLYNAYIRKDFPRRERRPLFMIRALYAKANYRCLVLEENGVMLAYATFLCGAGMDSVLLDHFAVKKELRGQRIGSRFLALLKEYWSEKEGIFIECEKPDAAKNQGEREMRNRRIQFYVRAGSTVTPLDWKVFGVDYSILWLPTRKDSSTDAQNLGTLAALYLLTLPNRTPQKIKASLHKMIAPKS